MNDNSFSKKDLQNCYDLYFDAIRNYVFFKVKDAALAEDIVQETFIKLWKKKTTGLVLIHFLVHYVCMSNKKAKTLNSMQMRFYFLIR